MMPGQRQYQLSRPSSFLPVYSIGLALLHLWLVHTLQAAGREWLLWDPAHPLRIVPLALAVLLGLGAIALWLAAWTVRRRGHRPVNRIACGISAVTSLIVLYSLLHLTGFWLGFL